MAHNDINKVFQTLFDDLSDSEQTEQAKPSIVSAKVEDISTFFEMLLDDDTDSNVKD